MSCSSGSCTCGFVYKNKVRNSQASPSPQLLPTTPFQGRRSAAGWWEAVCAGGGGGGQVVRGRWRGVTAPPRPRRRTLPLEQLAGEPLACLGGVFFYFFFFFFPFPFPFTFHHLHRSLVTLILPALPHPSTAARRGLGGRVGPRGQLLGREGGLRHRRGTAWAPRWSGPRGSRGSLKTDLFFFFFNGQLLQSEGGAAEGGIHPPPPPWRGGGHSLRSGQPRPRGLRPPAPAPRPSP